MKIEALSHSLHSQRTHKPWSNPTYNDLAASIAVYNREKEEKEEQRKQEKKKSDEEKAEKKRQQQLKDQEEHDRLLPGCREDVEIRGKLFVLGCNVERKKAILKHYFECSKALYKMKKSELDQEIELYFAKMNEAATTNASVEGAAAVATTTATEAATMEAAVNEAFNAMIEATREETEAAAEDMEDGRTRSGSGRKRRRTEKGEEYAAASM